MDTTAPVLYIRLLGSFEAAWQQRSLTRLRTRKALALLAYLSVEAGRPLPREKLMSLLWPELSLASAQTNLRQVLYQIRQVIPAAPDLNDPDNPPTPFLLANRQSVQINHDYPIRLDVATFRELVGQGDENALRQAAALYRGDFLSELYLADSNEFEDWAAGIRADLRSQAEECLVDLAEMALARGDYAEAERAARQNLTLDNLNERGQRQLMIALARSGRRHAALEQFQDYETLLLTEVAVSPSEEMATLIESIRAGDFEAAPGSTSPVEDTAMRPIEDSALISQLTSFVGRRSELERLNQLLGDPETRLITILGPGGIGKTRLALAAGEKQLSRSTDSAEPLFPDGVHFVSLASLSSKEQIIPAIAEAINLRLLSSHDGSRQALTSAGSRPPRRQLLDYLAPRRILIIMDNFEHLLDGGRLLIDMLRAAPELKLLVTSRVELRVQGEQHLQLSGLSVSNGQGGTTSATVVEPDAHALFRQRALQVRPDFTLSEEERSHLDRICQLVEGLPLGIELAAIWVSMLPLEAIADQIQQDVDFLEADLLDLEPRHQSIRAVFEGAWRRLNQNEKDVFAQLSVFCGPFTLEAARQVIRQAGDRPLALQTIARLTGQSILQYEARRDRYRLHELLRQYAAEKLAKNEVKESAARDRHAHYYSSLLQPATKAATKTLPTTVPGGGLWQQVFSQADKAIENIQVAWRWIIENGRYDLADSLIDPLCRYYLARGRVEDGLSLCRALNEHLNQLGEEEDSAHLATLTIRSLAWQGTFGGAIGYSEQAEQQLRHSLRLVDQLPEEEPSNQALRASILLNLGRIVPMSRRHERRQLLEESQRLSREAGDLWTEAEAYTILSEHAWFVGLYVEARQLNQQALAIYRQLQESGYIALNLLSLSWTAMWIGNLDEARTLIDEALATYRESDDERILSYGNTSLANLYSLNGNYEDAYRLYDRARDSFENHGLTWDADYASLVLTYYDLHLGRFARGQDQIESVIDKLRRKLGTESPFGYACIIRGMAALSMGERDLAEIYLQEGLEAHQLNDQVSDTAGAHAFLALTHYWLGKRQSALNNLKQAIRIAHDYQAWIPMSEALPAAILLLSEGEDRRPELAQQLVGLARNYPYVTRSQFFGQLAWQAIESFTSELPPDMVDAAREEGQLLELWPTAVRLLEELPIS